MKAHFKDVPGMQKQLFAFLKCGKLLLQFWNSETFHGLFDWNSRNLSGMLLILKNPWGIPGILQNHRNSKKSLGDFMNSGLARWVSFGEVGMSP